MSLLAVASNNRVRVKESHMCDKGRLYALTLKVVLARTPGSVK